MSLWSGNRYNRDCSRPLLEVKTTKFMKEVKAVGDEDQRVWVHHSYSQAYLENGPLRQGRTAWLHSADKNDWMLTDVFPSTIELVKSLDSRKPGRVYIHRLLPKEQILKHADNEELYHHQHDRYHLYLNWPTGAELFHIGNVVPNQVCWFNPFIEHEYVNNGNQPWYFLVFDYKLDAIK